MSNLIRILPLKPASSLESGCVSATMFNRGNSRLPFRFGNSLKPIDDFAVKGHLKHGTASINTPLFPLGFLYAMALPVITIIISVCTPFQVRFFKIYGAIIVDPDQIICLVFVLMVYAWVIVWVWDECFRDKAMHQLIVPTTVFIKCCTNISVSIKRLFHNIIAAARLRPQCHYATKIAHFIQTFKSSNIFPNFVHNSLCFNMLNIQNKLQINKCNYIAI